MITILVKLHSLFKKLFKKKEFKLKKVNEFKIGKIDRKVKKLNGLILKAIKNPKRRYCLSELIDKKYNLITELCLLDVN